MTARDEAINAARTVVEPGRYDDTELSWEMLRSVLDEVVDAVTPILTDRSEIDQLNAVIKKAWFEIRDLRQNAQLADALGPIFYELDDALAEPVSTGLAPEPEPSEIDQLKALVVFLGTRHTVDFTDAGWNMTHPVTCRFIPGGLKNCPVNAGALYEWDDPPVDEPGEYVVDLDAEGSIEIGERVEHPEPPVELWATLRAVLDSEGTA